MSPACNEMSCMEVSSIYHAINHIPVSGTVALSPLCPERWWSAVRGQRHMAALAGTCPYNLCKPGIRPGLAPLCLDKDITINFQGKSYDP